MRHCRIVPVDLAPRRPPRPLLWLTVWALGCAPLVAAPTKPEVPDDLTALSLDDLLNVQVRVTSVTRTSESAQRAPAALFVISQEDIRRSGATSIPEALRLAPGVFVARLDANKWAISIRGANSRFFNKLLVLIDGRTVYDPLHAGTYWDVQDTILEDVDRIEIIRGPGAALWGANAVSGVINVITKEASKTQDSLVGVIAGNEEKEQEYVRIGGKAGEKGHYRIWGKFLERDDFAQANGTDANDGWQALRGGYRVDWAPTGRDSMTVAGDVYGGKAEQVTGINEPRTGLRLDSSGIPFEGHNTRFKWHRNESEKSDWSLQLYYDRTERTETGFEELRDTYDLDFQRHLVLEQGRDLVYGFGHRLTADTITNASFITLVPTSYDYDVTSAFFQYRLPLHQDRLQLTLGSRFEYNDYTGFEFHPTARFLWTPSPEEAGWFAVSRAVRTPSRLEHDLGDILTSPVSVARFADRSRVDSEKLLAYEAGYRTQISKDLNFDAAAFYERFQQLPRVELPSGAPFFEPLPAPGRLVIPGRLVYDQKGTARGYELFFDYIVNEDWRLALGFSHIALNFQTGALAMTPEDKWELRSYLALTDDLELNSTFYRLEKLRGSLIPGYVRADANLVWHVRPEFDLSLVGQNLLDRSHPEFAGLSGGRGIVEIQRSIFGKATARF